MKAIINENFPILTNGCDCLKQYNKKHILQMQYCPSNVLKKYASLSDKSIFLKIPK